MHVGGLNAQCLADIRRRQSLGSQAVDRIGNDDGIIRAVLLRAPPVIQRVEA